MIRKNQFMIKGDQKIQTFSRSPRQIVRGAKWSTPPNSTFYAANKMKIIFKSDGFLQNVLRDFWVFSKIKNGPFSGPIYHQIHLDRVKKAYTLMTSMEKQKKCTSQIFDFWKFITHFLKWSEEHFSKYQNMWINENLSTRSAKLPVMFYWRELANRCKFFFSSISLSRMGSILGRICFGALILSDQNFISHDLLEFQIKKIRQQCVQNITPKTKATS